MAEQTCPCCGSVLLRHVRNSGPYWMCISCRQEMPARSQLSDLSPEPSPDLNQDTLAALDGLESLDSLQQRLHASITSTESTSGETSGETLPLA